MKKHGLSPRTPARHLLLPPAYPWSARDLLSSLRQQLGEEHRQPMTYQRLAQIMGQSTSTTHHWFESYHHPHLVGFFCLLERLTPAQRQAFIEAHCRVFPSLSHPWLAHAPVKTGKLLELLHQKAGLTLVVGGTDAARTFVVSALGHTYLQMEAGLHAVCGIDLHRPTTLVPVSGVRYIDQALGPKQVRELVLAAWPRVLTASAGLVIANRLWSAVPQIRVDLLRSARSRHVILAEAGTPDVAALKKQVSTPIHVVSVSAAQHPPEAIRVDCRRVKTRKSP